MKVSMRRFLWIAVLGVMFVIAVPADSLAQGRGRGRGRGHDQSGKCGKFVNCHDARDGRWDGRGPKRSVLHNGIFVRRSRGHQRRFGDFDHRRLVRSRRFHRA
jgi:hypothetical protein